MTADLDLNETHYASPTVTLEDIHEPYTRLAYAPIAPGTVTLTLKDGTILADNGHGELIDSALAVWGLIHYGTGEIEKLIAHATYDYDPLAIVDSRRAPL